jgi:hypothetical protein
MLVVAMLVVAIERSVSLAKSPVAFRSRLPAAGGWLESS